MSLLTRFRRSRRKSMLGLDIGADGVRAVLLRRQRERHWMEWAEVVSLSDMQGFVDYEVVAERLAPVLRAHDARKLPVAALPPWNSARVTLEEMPEMEPDRFARATTLLFQRSDTEGMQDPVNQALAQPARTNDSGRSVTDALLASMDGVLMRGLQDLCRQLELDLQWLIPHPLCYGPLIENRFDDAHSVFVVDIGASQTRMYLRSGEAVRLSRKLKPCGNDILKTLCDELDVSWDTAAAVLKADSGQGPLAESDHEGTLARARPVLDAQLGALGSALATELERSRSYVRARYDLDVDHIVLTGGIAESKPLLELLERDLEATITVLNPFDVVEAENPPAMPDQFTSAIGAAMVAMRSPVGCDLHLSHLLASDSPGTGSSRLSSRRTRRVALGMGALTLLGSVATMELRTHARIRDARARTAEIEQELERLNDEAAEFDQIDNLIDLEDRMQALRALYHGRNLYTPYLHRLASCVPADAWLTRIDVEEEQVELPPDLGALLDEEALDDDGPEAAPAVSKVTPVVHVKLQGRCHDPEAVGRLVMNLEELWLVESVDQVDVRAETVEGDTTESPYSFAIEARPRLDGSPSSSTPFFPEDVAR